VAGACLDEAVRRRAFARAWRRAVEPAEMRAIEELLRRHGADADGTGAG
jgi:predicted RNA-binding protein YlxR (DUF448 family)